jgi:glycolate oxidase iron-sulfur subunit
LNSVQTPLPPPALGNSPNALSDAELKLLRLADQCVKCGYCLPHCPTYRLRQDEAESPRGRISLVQGLLWGELEASARLSEHLDNCLECRACEPVCPSLVRFGTLMDGARELQRVGQPRWRRSVAAGALGLLSDRRRLPLLARVARGYHRSGLARLASALGLTRQPRLGLLHRLGESLHPPQRLRPSSRDDAGNAPEVDVFLGCIAAGTQRATAAAAVQVLERIGFQARVPDGQGCCGAMHRHNGFAGTAQRQVEHNQRVFGTRRVVGYASACVAEMREHGGIDAAEICRLLVETPWPAGLRPRPSAQRIVVHEPCSHRNVLRDTAAVYALLARVPGLEAIPLRGNETCCGAAGTYLIQHPSTAHQLAAEKLAHLRELDVHTLVTTNTGCALHLAAEIELAGLDIEVIHPVELIDRATAPSRRREANHHR